MVSILIVISERSEKISGNDSEAVVGELSVEHDVLEFRTQLWNFCFLIILINNNQLKETAN